MPASASLLLRFMQAKVVLTMRRVLILTLDALLALIMGVVLGAAVVLVLVLVSNH